MGRPRLSGRTMVVLCNFQYWVIVGHGPAVLAAGAVGVVFLVFIGQFRESDENWPKPYRMPRESIVFLLSPLFLGNDSAYPLYC